MEADFGELVVAQNVIIVSGNGGDSENNFTAGVLHLTKRKYADANLYLVMQELAELVTWPVEPKMGLFM